MRNNKRDKKLKNKQNKGKKYAFVNYTIQINDTSRARCVPLAVKPTYVKF